MQSEAERRAGLGSNEDALHAAAGTAVGSAHGLLLLGLLLLCDCNCRRNGRYDDDYSKQQPDRHANPHGNNVCTVEGLWLIEEVLAPAVVATTEHAHDLPAGMEREGTGIAQQEHVIDFREHAISFAAVATVAAGDEVFPCGIAAARTRNDVIEREFARRQHHTTVLALITVAQENIFARECTCLMRNAPVFKQANHRGHGNAAALRMQSETVLLFSARNALEHEYQRPSRATDIDGLVGRIEH